MADIKHVFFDLDHTLWDFERNSDLAYNKVFKKFELTIKLESFLKIYRPLNKQYWKLYRDEKVTKDELRYGRLKDAFDTLNYSISDTLIDTIATKYIDFLPEFKSLFEGTIELLEYLKNKYELHIITNGFEEVQNKKMLNSNISKYFTTITNSEIAGVKKPNPRVFEYALEIAKAKKEESIMIGDDLEADIQGALNTGLTAIHCNFDNQNIKNNSIISVTSLSEIKQYL
ncbi:MAG: YjjG family noncanonical pyrimidine nucleotidase [Polaribacter sp.]